MPPPHVSSLAPFVLRLAAGLTAGSLGIRRRARPPRSQTPRLSDSELRAHWTGMRAPGPTKLLRSAVLGTFALVLLAGAGVYAGYEIKSSREMKARAVALTAGDPDLGRRLAQRYGCASCHTIPGVPGADGQVGPSLQGFAARVYVGGVAANTPDRLIQWLEDPRSLDPKTAMPSTGMSRAEARHVAAYLYTLR
jgi:cytochrome c2